ncbi:MAG: TetR/AcrR family transcriptional regulator [Lactobacillaceae bacterium]|jgi:AcrR family transcriptional regulator|nr:TetR/AcrR family transcriptional regulator [Lactobacillaceae bacterium]
MTNKRELNKQLTTEHILKTATYLFNLNGYDQTTTKEIAKSAAMSPVTLYKYFPNKHAIFKAIVIRDIDNELTHAEANIAQADFTDAKNLSALLTEHHALTTNYSDQMYFDVMRDFAGEFGDNEVSDFYRERTDHFWRLFIQRLRTAKLIKPTMSTEALLLYIDVWLSYFSNPESLKKTANIFVEIINQIIELFFFGMLDPNDKTRTTMKKSILKLSVTDII